MHVIEKNIFARMRWNKNKMFKFGFQQKDKDTLIYKDKIFNGDFNAILEVTKDGQVEGKIFDEVTSDEYYQLHQESANGAYVNSVRDSYTKWLQNIADQCCTSVLFSSEQANRISKLISEKWNIQADFPWTDTSSGAYGVFRHPENKKWFALIMNVKKNVLTKDGSEDEIDIINLKKDLNRFSDLEFPQGVYPAYHMNHKYWISVMLTDVISDETLLKLLEDSFRLTL